MGKKKNPPNRIGRSKKEQRLRDQMTTEFSHFLSDIEFRVSQAYEVARRNGEAARLFAEDLVSTKHQITGYTTTSGTPVGGFTWASVKVVYNGVTYTTADGNCLAANKYVWFIKPASGTGPVTLSQGATKPTLAAGDCLLFINNAGVPISVLEATLPPVVADGAIGSSELQDNAVTQNKLLDSAVTNNKLAGSIANTKLAGGITGTQLANNTITTTQVSTTAGFTGGQIADNAITNAKILDGAVDSGSLADGSATASKLSIFQHLIL
jgi:hypothetical protein